MLELGSIPLPSQQASIVNYIIKVVLGQAAYDRAVQRNSGSLAEDVPTAADTDAWQFVIPLKEIEPSQGKVIQNPL